jgi:hypothetical protein
MTVFMNIANLTGPLVAALTLAESLWLPFQLAGAFIAIMVFDIWAISETTCGSSIISTTSQTPEERAFLLQEPAESQSGIENSHSHWKSFTSKFTALTKNRMVVYLLIITFIKQTAFFSEFLFVQYASEKFKIPYSQATWFIESQAAGAMLTLIVVLPVVTQHLQRTVKPPGRVDLLTTRGCLLVLTLSYFSIKWASSIPLYAIGKSC